jgi:DNA helicase-2/ATP-dependent DNA helicase PcrA
MRAEPAVVGPALVDSVRELFAERLGLGADLEAAGEEGRERAASLELIVSIVRDLASTDPVLTVAAVRAELDRRDAEEAAGSTSGVNLLTYHRAKGLEWDAVFLPALEEGLLPVRQAKDDAAIAEERRLLYVGITRARRHLALSWAQRRVGPGDKETRRQPSRFLAALDRRPTAERRVVTSPPARVDAPIDGRDRRLLEALQAWRRDRAKADVVPAYVVAHDATLVAIAEARPRTIAALQRVRGMGPVKLERYGPEILAIVARVA